LEAEVRLKYAIEGNAAVFMPERDHLDVTDRDDFIAAFEEAAASSGSVLFVLDLTGVRFVDSSGLGAVMSVLRKLRAEGRDMVACSVAKNVLVLFDLVRLDRVMQVFPDREAALRALAAR